MPKKLTTAEILAAARKAGPAPARPAPPKPRPEVELPQELLTLRTDFLAVLDDGTERDAQAFLDNHRNILDLFSSYSEDHDQVFREYQLGAEYRVDFLVTGTAVMSRSLIAHFIELESPKCRLFTKAGNPTAELTHAIRQIRDWKSWIRDNRSYFLDGLRTTTGRTIRAGSRYDYQYGAIEHFTIVMGRRDELTTFNREQLRSLIVEDGHEIMTYDGLIDRYCASVSRAFRAFRH